MRWVLGFDGGGTKTLCVLMDERGAILSESRSGPSNPSRIGVPPAFAAVREAAEQAATRANIELKLISALCAGLAGTSDPRIAAEMRALLAAEFPQAAVQLCTDLDLALAATGAATNTEPALVLIAGTGSAAIGRDGNGQTLRVGGHGPHNSDEGSAYDIGRRALETVSAENISFEANSVLGKKILTEMGASNWLEARQRAQSAPEEVYANLFPVVAASADAGSVTAQDILREAAGELAALVCTLAGRLSVKGQRFLLAKTGGMIGRSVFFDALLDERLSAVAPKARIVTLSVPLAEVAARLALKLMPAAGTTEK